LARQPARRGRTAPGPPSLEEFERTVRTTGCFRRGKAIRDPGTQEIIGYEMEQVPLLRAAGEPDRPRRQ